jgi:fumarate reductase (CoM/CoB) subunit A
VAAGMDGAERIDGGPAITWCLTMGYIAGREAARTANKLNWLKIDPEQVKAEQEKIELLYTRKDGRNGSEAIRRLKDIMWDYGACVRDKKGLETALSQIEEIRDNAIPQLGVPDQSRVFNKKIVEAVEAGNLVRLSEMIVRSALMREETRKSHYRTDFPERNDADWLKNIVISKDHGKPLFSLADPVITRMKPQKSK